jgi:hypothetical protein
MWMQPSVTTRECSWRLTKLVKVRHHEQTRRHGQVAFSASAGCTPEKPSNNVQRGAEDGNISNWIPNADLHVARDGQCTISPRPLRPVSSTISPRLPDFRQVDDLQLQPRD